MGYMNGCLLVSLCRLIERKPNLQVANKGLPQLYGKNTCKVLVPYRAWNFLSEGKYFKELPLCFYYFFQFIFYLSYLKEMYIFINKR